MSGEAVSKGDDALFHDDWYWPPRHDLARWWQSEQPRLWNGPRRSGSKISYSKHLLLVCGTFGCRELSIEHTTWSAFCILRSLPPHEWRRTRPAKRQTALLKRFDGHPKAHEDTTARGRFYVRVLVLAVCGLADCVARLLPKTTTCFWHGDCSWPPRHPSSHSVVATTNVALIGTCPSVHTYQRYVRPYIRPWYSGATGRLVGVVSREDITVYYGSYSTATSAAARISTGYHGRYHGIATIPYGSTRY